MKSSSDLKPKLVSYQDWIKVTLSGVCMGAADIVPGISGGTIAFIMGFYDNLLGSISSFNLHAFSLLSKLQFRKFFNYIGWEFLLALLTGIAFSFLMLASLFHSILGHEVYRIYLYAAFFGLIIASIYFCSKHVAKWSYGNILGLIAGSLCGLFLTGTTIELPNHEPLYNVHINLGSFPHAVKNFDSSTQKLLNVPESTLPAMIAKQVINSDTLVQNVETQKSGSVKDCVSLQHRYGLSGWMVLCGAIAVTAMLLPGISGSYMLTILGAYSVAIGALADFSTGLRNGIFHWDDFFTLLSMLIGILVGALIFSRVVHWLMIHYKSLTVATMIGFMIGALPSVWPYYNYIYWINPLKVDKGPLLEAINPILPHTDSYIFWVSLAFALFGFFLVIGVEYAANRKKGVL